MKPLYIIGSGCISPQRTFDENYFFETVSPRVNNKLFCQEPDYTNYFDPMAVRRMSRILKFGTAAAKIALADAAVAEPDIIATGTGLGCLTDSELFLTNITKSNEGLVSPTAFIQSTHNTVSSLVALQIKSHKPNNTFSNRGFSFESAMLEALMIAAEDSDAINFLIGAYDELSDYSFDIMSRMGAFKKETYESDNFFSEGSSGVVAGEGATYFMLSKTLSAKTYCRLLGCKMIFQPENDVVFTKSINAFLETNRISIDDVDVVMSGISGDSKRDKILQVVNKNLFVNQTIVAFKHLCGEYMTAAAFGVWLGVNMIKRQQIPDATIIHNRNKKPNTILVCNAYKNYYSLTLLAK
jgi:3-oxoacyl-[acyl-carrier-protein] synthase II